MSAINLRGRLIAAGFAMVVTSTAFSMPMAQADPRARALFENKDTLRVRIEAPFTTLMRDRDEEDRDGLLYILSTSGTEQKFDLKIRTRGNFRGKAKHCNFAPLRLNFRKKQVSGTEFDSQDVLKLVTHCQNLGRAYEQSLLLEYLAYRILNQLTDLSFRVRLLHIDYVDTENKNKTRTKYAFLIEDDNALSRRIRLQAANVSSLSPEQLDPSQAALSGIFEYLIGNTDYSTVLGAADAPCCHNTKLFIGPDGRFIPVVYDFDLSGVVDAPYATPNPKYDLQDVKERLYLGHCLHNDLLDAAIGRTIENRNAIKQLIEKQDGLTKQSRRKTMRYLDSYYDRVSNPAKRESDILKKCQ
jgi:hypothetical protein